MKILIKELSNDEFQVTVNEITTTIHKVNLSDNVYKKLTNEKINKKKLIEFSFKFLLERESNTEILPTFELSIISNYFPEYANSINERISNH